MGCCWSGAQNDKEEPYNNKLPNNGIPGKTATINLDQPRISMVVCRLVSSALGRHCRLRPEAFAETVLGSRMN